VNDPLSVLDHWFDNPSAIAVRRVEREGFSGAGVWHVASAEGQYALRCWPRSMDGGRVAATLALQKHLHDDGLPVPSPVAGRDGAITIVREGWTWGLASWLPGVADYWQSPDAERLGAALAMLARTHLSAARAGYFGAEYQYRVAASPALRKRFEMLSELVTGRVEELKHHVGRVASGESLRIAKEAIDLVRQAAPRALGGVSRLREVDYALQWCLRDCWHDHVLFTGNRVTGLIDFDAADIDAPAMDVARMLGSMAGDDQHAWRVGLDAYDAIRRLSDDESAAVKAFDVSGTVASAVNWIEWLWGAPEKRLSISDYRRPLARLGRLIERLRVLAARSD
jgi:Ser/Thr protein kinase RdoA (MazF antagonist)